MPFYQRLGKIPAKRHIVYRKNNGELYQEELVGTQGFSGQSSLVYHLFPPTQVRLVGKPYFVQPKIADDNNMRSLSFNGFEIPAGEDYIKSRSALIR